MSTPAAFEQARARARMAGAGGDWPQAARWAERAWRLADRRPLPSLELAAALVRAGDRRATVLLAQAARRHADFPVLLALAAAQWRDGAPRDARATLHRLLGTVAVDTLDPAAGLANEIAASAGLAGWLGWRDGRLLFGAAGTTPGQVGLALNRRPLTLDWVPEAPCVWSAALPPDMAGALRADPPLLGAPLRPDWFRRPAGAAARTGAGVQGWVWFPHDPVRQPAVTITVRQRSRIRSLVAPLAPAEPNEAAPFARRWTFDIPLSPGASIEAVTEAGSGQALSLTPAASEMSAPPTRSGPDPRAATDTLLQRYRVRPCTLLVTHDEGGGVEHHIRRRVDTLSRHGQEGLLHRSRRTQPGAVRLGNIDFQLPADGPALLALLRAIGPVRIEFHHLHRHDELVWQLAASLDVPYDVVLHDYALLCPRITLIGTEGRYCGKPPISQCDRCAAAAAPAEPGGVAALRQRSAALLAGAAHITAPSADIAARFRRHVPAAVATVRPWEAGRRRPRPMIGPATNSTPGLVHVCVVGALNRHKGVDVLLDCARDAAIQGLPLRFTVVGHTSDDAALIEAGAFVTGAYVEAERADLVARQRATVGWLPSLWPEPWCYALTGLLDAGLPTLCSDIGAQADRVRAAGGSVVPLGTSPQEINRRLLEMTGPQTTEPGSL